MINQQYADTSLKLDDVMNFEGVVLTNLDQASTIFFQRELEFILPQMFKFPHARINARNLFPIDRSAGPVARTITWRQFRNFGQAQIIADYANDVPIVNSEGEEVSTKVRGVAAGAQWDIDEIRSARALNRPLDRMYAEGAREAMLREENRVAFEGDAAFGLTGLLSTGTGIPVNSAPTGTWSGASGDNILADMFYAEETIVNGTGEQEAPDTLGISTPQFLQIRRMKHGTATDRTVLQYFLENSTYVKQVVPVREFTNAGGVGGSTNIMCAFERSPNKIRLQVPLDIEQLAPEQHQMVIRVLWHMRIGGLTIHKPKSLHIVTGL